MELLVQLLSMIHPTTRTCDCHGHGYFVRTKGFLKLKVTDVGFVDVTMSQNCHNISHHVNPDTEDSHLHFGAILIFEYSFTRK